MHFLGMPQHPLATIGYESETQQQVIERLKAARIDTLIDVRAIAASRRAGFSKSLLASSLAEAGIEYIHLRQLGTPKAGRDAARHGRIAEMTAIYEGHLAEPTAQVELARATAMAEDRRVALLCYEQDANCCHRKIVAAHIRERLHCQIVDL
jgi:uncharacterized protein (DUF488 family)